MSVILWTIRLDGFGQLWLCIIWANLRVDILWSSSHFSVPIIFLLISSVSIVAPFVLVVPSENLRLRWDNTVCSFIIFYHCFWHHNCFPPIWPIFRLLLFIISFSPGHGLVQSNDKSFLVPLVWAHNSVVFIGKSWIVEQISLKKTLPKAQRTRGLSSSCQSHIASSSTNLDRISSSESWLSINKTSAFH